MPKRSRVTMNLIRAGAVSLALAACTPIYDRHGYTPAQEDLDNLIVGVDTRGTVEEFVGPPSASGVMRDEAWYYVSSNFITRGARAREEYFRQVVAISFDQNGVVKNIERFGLEDGMVVVLNRRVTDDNIEGVSFLGQLLGNVGNLTADQFFDN
jgi:outer membrane protein assembly factor BamE (lipoprotein component of BamABCDE complex)